MRKILAVFVLAIGFGLAAQTARADSSGLCPSVGAATDCNIFINITSNSTATISFTDPLNASISASTSLYDKGYCPDCGNDNYLVGIYNGSSQTINGVYLTGSEIFSLNEGDGICASSMPWYNSSMCSAFQYQGGFNGPNTVFYVPNFAGGNTSSGFVFFGTWNNTGTNFTNSGLAPGQSAYFSLDGQPVGASPVPEPATLPLFATGLIGMAGFIRRKLSNI